LAKHAKHGTKPVYPHQYEYQTAPCHPGPNFMQAMVLAVVGPESVIEYIGGIAPEDD
jgi:hypothetical protein